jgi:hypothetical protein
MNFPEKVSAEEMDACLKEWQLIGYGHKKDASTILVGYGFDERNYWAWQVLYVRNKNGYWDRFGSVRGVSPI